MLAPDCLQQACVFVSCFRRDVSPQVLKDQLVSWYSEIGRGFLWGNPNAWEEDEEDMQGDEEEELPAELTSAAGEGDCDEEAKELENHMDSAQKLALVEKELMMFQDDPTFQSSNDDSQHTGSDFEDDDAMDRSELDSHLAQDVNLNIFTLGDVLRERNILPNHVDFTAVHKSNQSEGTMLKRIRTLLPTMSRLVTLVRLKEGVLTKASVVGMKRCQNLHNVLEHQLALARCAFQCFSQNQSRHALWQGYSERVLLELKEHLSPDMQPGARYLQNVGPMSGTPKNFQVVVVRPFQAGEGGGHGLRFGVPVSVWRLGRNKGKSGTPKIVSEGKIPVHLCDRIHVMLLNVWFDENSGKTYLIGSFLAF